MLLASALVHVLRESRERKERDPTFSFQQKGAGSAESSREITAHPQFGVKYGRVWLCPW